MTSSQLKGNICALCFGLAIAVCPAAVIFMQSGLQNEAYYANMGVAFLMGTGLLCFPAFSRQ